MAFLPARVSILSLGLSACVATTGAAPGPIPGPTPDGPGAPPAGEAKVDRPGTPPPQRVRVEQKGDLIASLPHQKWKELPGRQVGLLITMSNPWGRAIDWSGAVFPRTGGYQRRTYYFYADGASAQALYFVSDGRGENFLKNWSVPLPGGAATHYDAAMFGPKTPNSWGLKADAHIVELEVNGGQGAPVGLHFVATDAAVLDGTPGLPLDATRALGTARERYDAWVREAEPQVDQALKDGAQALGGHVGDVKQETAEGFFPSWDDQAQELRVLFVRRASHSSSKQTGMQEVGRCTKYDNMNRQPPPPPPPPPPQKQKPQPTPRVPAPQLPGGLAACPAPRQVMTFEVRSVQVEYGVLVVFDSHGRLVEEVRYAPTMKNKKDNTMQGGW